MTRQEFLEELQVALQGEMSQARINDHVLYYDNYIMEKARKGKSEQQVIDELGNPRLIAKTLIDTTERLGSAKEEDNSSYQEEDRNGGFRADYSESAGWDVRYKGFKLNSWYGRLLLIVIGILILIVVANVVAFLLPLAIIAMLIGFFFSLVFRKRR